MINHSEDIVILCHSWFFIYKRFLKEMYLMIDWQSALAVSPVRTYPLNISLAPQSGFRSQEAAEWWWLLVAVDHASSFKSMTLV